MPEQTDLINILEGYTAPEQTPAPVVDSSVTPVADTTPVTTAPVADTNNQTPAPDNTDTPKVPEAPAFDFDAEIVKATNGSIKSSAELATLLEKTNRLNDLESQLRTKEETLVSLQAKADANPFANAYVEKYNQLLKDGATPAQMDAFQALHRAGDIDQLDPVEAKVLALQLREGISPDEARRYVNRSLKLDPEQYTEDEIADEKLRLKIESRTDKDFLKSHKAEVETSPSAQTQQEQVLRQQQQQEHLRKLEPLVNNVLKDIPNLFKGFSINGKDGEAANRIDLPVSTESLQSVQNYVQKFVEENGSNITATPEGQQDLQRFAENILAQNNWKTWIAEATSQRELQVRAEYTNPTPINRGVDAPRGVNTTKSEQEQTLLDSYY